MQQLLENTMPIPGYYNVRFTDPASKTKNNKVSSIIVEPFTTNGTKRPNGTTLDSHATIADTSLVLLGKGIPSYGETVAEDFLHLLENFAGALPPSNPVNGQLWLQTGDAIPVASRVSDTSITLTGDYTAEVQTIIDNFAYYNANPALSQKTLKQITIQFINPNVTHELLLARPISVFFLTGVTTITFVASPTAYSLQVAISPPLSYTLPPPTNVVFDYQRDPILRIYRVRKDQIIPGTLDEPGAWVKVNNIAVGTTEPNDSEDGELWIDTLSTPNLRFKDGGIWSPGFLRLDGGTITGQILLTTDGVLPATPTLDAHVPTKKYVDDQIAVILSYDDTAILGRLDVLEASTEAAAIAALEGDVTTLQGDVTTLQTDISNKYDKTGGVLTGDATFTIPSPGTSPGVKFTGDVGYTGHQYHLTGVRAGNATNLSLKLFAPTGAGNHSSFTISHTKGANTEIPAFQVRELYTLTAGGIYEESLSLALGTVPNPKSKYVTGTEFDNNLNSLNPIVQGISFNSLTMALTISSVNWASGGLTVTSTSEDLSHTHAEYNAPNINDAGKVLVATGAGTTAWQLSPGREVEVVDVVIAGVSQWTRPGGFNDDDTVIFRIWGAGASGAAVIASTEAASHAGGGGGGGFFEYAIRYGNLSSTPNAYTITVGAGGPPQVRDYNVDGIGIHPGIDGGNSTIVGPGLPGTATRIGSTGGKGGMGSISGTGRAVQGGAQIVGDDILYLGDTYVIPTGSWIGGYGGNPLNPVGQGTPLSGGFSLWGGGGGGAANDSTSGTGGASGYGGNGGVGCLNQLTAELSSNGAIPGGGGGGGRATDDNITYEAYSGSGAPGRVQILIAKGYVRSFGSE